MFKRKSLNKLIVGTIILSLLAATGVVTANDRTKKFKRNRPPLELYTNPQKVYYADEPLPIIARRLERKIIKKREKKLGRKLTKKEISDQKKIRLYNVRKKLTETLTLVTPEFAEKKFGIDWIDNSIRTDHIKHENSQRRKLINLGKLDKAQEKLGAPIVKLSPNILYPIIVICKMGENGYGLFTMADIAAGKIIAEYTGKQVKYSDNKKPKHSFSTINTASNTGIDCLHSGNGSRFTKHLMNKNDLSSYDYEMSESFIASHGHTKVNDYIATGNAYVRSIRSKQDDKRTALMSSTKIKRFKQIGLTHTGSANSQLIGYTNYKHTKELYLYNKNGEIIPEEDYQTSHIGIVLFDEIASKKAFAINQLDKSCLEDQLKKHKEISIFPIKNYILIEPINYDIIYIVEADTWHEKISKPKTRISIFAYCINVDTDIDKFIPVLENTLKFNHNKTLRTNILKAAKDNRFEEADKLLAELSQKKYDDQDWKHDL